MELVISSPERASSKHYAFQISFLVNDNNLVDNHPCCRGAADRESPPHWFFGFNSAAGSAGRVTRVSARVEQAWVV
jgi:hypothetical protein